MAAYEYARALPYVDPHRMILAGHSAGGMVALFTAGVRQPEGLVAVLAFAAGRGGEPGLPPGGARAAPPPPRRLPLGRTTVTAPVGVPSPAEQPQLNPRNTQVS